MPSYVKFEDVGTAIQAGADLQTAAEKLAADVHRVIGDNGEGGELATQAAAALRRTDKYSEDFVNGDKGYAHDSGEMAKDFTQFVKDVMNFGTNVSLSASTLMYVDAANGANLAKSTVQKV
jgi:hypothetical protein